MPIFILVCAFFFALGEAQRGSWHPGGPGGCRTVCNDRGCFKSSDAQSYGKTFDQAVSAYPDEDARETMQRSMCSGLGVRNRNNRFIDVPVIGKLSPLPRTSPTLYENLWRYDESLFCSLDDDHRPLSGTHYLRGNGMAAQMFAQMIVPFAEYAQPHLYGDDRTDRLYDRVDLQRCLNSVIAYTCTRSMPARTADGVVLPVCRHVCRNIINVCHIETGLPAAVSATGDLAVFLANGSSNVRTVTPIATLSVCDGPDFADGPDCTGASVPAYAPIDWDSPEATATFFRSTPPPIDSTPPPPVDTTTPGSTLPPVTGGGHRATAAFALVLVA